MPGRSGVTIVTAFALLLAVVQPALAADPAPAGWKSDLLAWRAQRAKDLQAPNGWLTLIGLEWLKPGDNSVGSAMSNAIVIKATVPPSLGIVKLADSTLQMLPPKGGYPKSLLVDGKPPIDPQPIESDNPGTPSKITSGSIAVTAIHRGDRYGLRIRDSKSPQRTQFHGLKWYAPNPAYRVVAKWVPYSPPRTVMIPTVLGTEVKYETPGAAEFELEGKTYRVEPVVEASDEKQLFFIFRDTTSKSETYGAGRFLYTPLPDHGLSESGTVVLDFNRAENPPCAYTPYATCPLPLPQNRLPIAIPAGQQRYHE